MAHFAFVAPPFLGHVNPMVALARELVGRGHRATFLGMADLGSFLGTASDVGFHPVGRDSHPPGSLRAITGRMSAVGGFRGLPGIVGDVAMATDMLARELPDALRAIGADLVLCDGTEAAGGLAAEHLGLPHVTVANALPLNREPAVPPPFTGWRYDPSRWGIERNGGGYRVADWLMRRHGDVIAHHAERLGLPPRRRLDSCLSPWAQVAQLPVGLDFPRREAPSVLHHCGPFRSPGATEFPLPADDGRPLAYASLGTLQGGRIALMRRIADAAERAGLRLVIAHGGALTAEQVASLPGRPDVHAFVPQPAILAGAALAILNGGMNTVLDAAAAGVPVLLLPIAFEQGAIGARVERAGAGRVASHRLASAARLGKVARRLLADPTYAEAARRLKREIAGAGRAPFAADIVERVLSTGRPVTRADASVLRVARSGTRPAPAAARAA